MSETRFFDVIVVGGGIAGSTLAGVLARAGLGVLVVEKEERFRDRIRGEGTWPWGVAEVRAIGLDDLLDQAGVVEMLAFKRFEGGKPVEVVWDLEATGGVTGMGFSHPRFQEAAFTWAASQGATTLRPAKATGFALNGQASLTVAIDGREVEYRARLIVGADGKLSAARRWTGGKSLADAEHHRMGGVLISGAVYDRTFNNYAWTSGEAVNWFSAGTEHTRLYLIMSGQRVRETGVDRSFAANIAYAAAQMPEGALDNAQQAGPIGYFSNNDVWASRVAGNHVVLIGDAAGASDPSQGHGTSLLFRDVRVLSELLLADADWDAASEEFATQRERAFEVIHQTDLWHGVFFDSSAEAARLREGHARALQHDPALNEWALLEAHGPDGFVADEAARRRFFGEDLA